MDFFDVIVIGAGHAGCEAAVAAAKLNCKTLVLAANLDAVAFLACNPSIGGTAKGQIVKEIDALGGQMALIADKCTLQMRMLNKSKGPAVYSPRAQVDKNAYHAEFKKCLEQTPGLSLRQGEAVKIKKIVKQGGSADSSRPDALWQVETAAGEKYRCVSLVVATGVYLSSKIFVGSYNKKQGPNGFAGCYGLSAYLKKLGFELRRFKTGTPARIHRRSVDFSATERQEGEESLPLSYLNGQATNKRECYLTYTTPETKEVILRHKEKAPIYNGSIRGVGPRYCPSIEDKVIRFADKERHQIFLEPEGEDTEEIYVAGLSSSMPVCVQREIIRTVKGLENAEIMRDAYAIEYDCIDPTELDSSLMSKRHGGLFFAGQICGTSGYEEAAGQGLVAGINAARFFKKQPPFVLSRNSSYIGVLIDDITAKGVDEPYRMMTGRAEHRLILRQDNADLRLTPLGRELGLVDDQRFEKFSERLKRLEHMKKSAESALAPDTANRILAQAGEKPTDNGATISALLKRPAVRIEMLVNEGVFSGIPQNELESFETEIKYAGYIAKAEAQMKSQAALEAKKLPQGTDFKLIKGLKNEAALKLNKFAPENLLRASEISGVSPADIQVLSVWLALRSRNEDKGD
ncbi:MAG: tRNA uridine-5-carboxymethylaminomethyl(34) synthesis enzyme MnmG [Clostridia bacterium]|nr:tRNA uridine-5-carboxymethylaminomethyl(34) synthesis enzyme MnmG [Clostridia bacterium]